MARTPKGPLFDPASRTALRDETRRGYVLVFVGVAVVVGALVGGLHYEEAPFLAWWTGLCSPEQFRYECDAPAFLHWSAAALGTLVMGLFLSVLLRIRRIPPTVTCRKCGGRGWIRDLRATGGRCPRCGHRRFRYRTLEATGVPVAKIWWVEDAAGTDLLGMERDRGFH